MLVTSSLYVSNWEGFGRYPGKLSESWIIRVEMEYWTFSLPAQKGNERVSSQILFLIQVRRAQKDLLVNVEWPTRKDQWHVFLDQATCFCSRISDFPSILILQDCKSFEEE